MKTKKWMGWMGVVSIFFVMGCATTSVKSVWKDPEFHRRSLTKTVVIGVHKKATLRRTFEDLFVEEFMIKGTQHKDETIQKLKLIE